jgi:hypothetical protein
MKHEFQIGIQIPVKNSEMNNRFHYSSEVDSGEVWLLKGDIWKHRPVLYFYL